ncbi:GNAT family N-acetyltransferase [Tropicibacter sp. S64]|uniref:GNAT family N-acetyltransferase n=1 Tax=Tropicibacter sp. S64 TaxID=3415122 RepID=UPI003C7B5CE5
MTTIACIDTPVEAVETILARHHALMRSQSPEESCHVMTADALRASGAKVYALCDAEGAICAVGALKPIGGGGVELKSMHVLAEMRGRGLGAALLGHLLDAARGAGATVAYLETGSYSEFAAARSLYERAGFEYCAPFGDYLPDPNSVFMLRRL